MRKVLKKQARKARAEQELYVNGHCTEDREEWRSESLRHCKEVRRRREKYKKKELNQFTDDGRRAVITVDLLLQANAKMSDNRVNGPEDAVVSEIIRQLPLETIYTITKCFEERFLGQMGKPDAAEEKDQKLQGHHADIGDVEVVRVLYYSASGKRKRT